MKRILIAVPVMEFIESATFKSIYELVVPDGYSCTFDAFRGYQLDDSRNHIARVAIEGGYDFLFFVDGDIVLPNDALVRLLSHRVQVISGIYPCKKLDRKAVEVFGNHEGKTRRLKPESLEPAGLFQVHSCGLGCTLVATEVLKRVGYPQFEYMWSLDPALVTSEDIYFFERVAKTGFPVYIDSSVKCQHIGKVVFSL
jgi:hypothetical protein